LEGVSIKVSRIALVAAIIVAPSYSAARSNLAVAAGLGQGGRKPKGAPKGQKTA